MLTCLTAMGKEVQGTESTTLDVSDIKWVYLSFKSEVNYADMGTDDILIEKTKSRSIIRIKSLTASFSATTVTVITGDGEVHTFILRYNQDPDALALNIKSNQRSDIDTIGTYRIELSEDRTSHIILPDKVTDITTGSDYIAAERAEDITNIVKCKSINAGFDIYQETSLTIVANDVIYPFIVTYNKNPKMVNVSVGKSPNEKGAIFDKTATNESDMRDIGEKILQKGTEINNIGVIDNKMVFALRSIFIDKDVMMYHISLSNSSLIDYDIDFIKCYIINKKTSKVETSQIDEKTPLYTFSKSKEERVKANGTYSVILFFNKFTIPDKHELYFEVFEKNGGRHMKFTVPHKELLKAKNIK